MDSPFAAADRRTPRSPAYGQVTLRCTQSASSSLLLARPTRQRASAAKRPVPVWAEKDSDLPYCLVDLQCGSLEAVQAEATAAV